MSDLLKGGVEWMTVSGTCGAALLSIAGADLKWRQSGSSAPGIPNDNQVSVTPLPILQGLANRDSKSPDQVALRLIILTERRARLTDCRRGYVPPNSYPGIRSCSITLAATRVPESSPRVVLRAR